MKRFIFSVMASLFAVVALSACAHAKKDLPQTTMKMSSLPDDTMVITCRINIQEKRIATFKVAALSRTSDVFSSTLSDTEMLFATLRSGGYGNILFVSNGKEFKCEEKFVEQLTTYAKNRKINLFWIEGSKKVGPDDECNVLNLAK